MDAGVDVGGALSQHSREAVLGVVLADRAVVRLHDRVEMTVGPVQNLDRVIPVRILLSIRQVRVRDQR